MNVGTDPTTANEATDTQHDAIRHAVREQYGAVATATSLAPSASPTPQKSSACSPGCCGPSPGASLGLGYSEDDLAAVPEGANLGLGCGNPHAIAALSTGERVLDLGAGGGFDCFLAASRVGPSGRVVGVDMTAEMVAKARKNARALGLSNVTFLLGEIEHLPVADASIDVILSNCVINLSPDKAAVFREAFRVLTPGGRLALSDVVALRPLPDALQHDLAALTGCVSGAASVDALTTYLAAAGFVDIRIRVNEASRVFIGDWLPGSGAEDYVASASIEARKTSEKGCCGPACCPKEAAP